MTFFFWRNLLLDNLVFMETLSTFFWPFIWPNRSQIRGEGVGLFQVLKVYAHGAHVRGTKASLGGPKSWWT